MTVSNLHCKLPDGEVHGRGTEMRRHASMRTLTGKHRHTHIIYTCTYRHTHYVHTNAYDRADTEKRTDALKTSTNPKHTNTHATYTYILQT